MASKPQAFAITTGLYFDDGSSRPLALYIDSRHQNGSLLAAKDGASRVEGLPVVAMDEALEAGILDANEGAVSLSVAEILALQVRAGRKLAEPAA